MTTTAVAPQARLEQRLTPRTLARTAGVLYALLLGAAFNEGYVIPHIVSGNAATTADNIRASSALFRAGILGDLLAGTIWVLLAMALYLLLRHVHRLAAAAMVVFAAIGGGVQVLNQLNQYTALNIATTGDYAHSLGTSGADALAQAFATMQQSGQVIDSMFFGLWLLPLGYLVVKSGYFPRPLGGLVIVGGCAYIVGLFANVLGIGAVGLAMLVPAGLAELSFMLWLLVRSVRVPAPPV